MKYIKLSWHAWLLCYLLVAGSVAFAESPASYVEIYTLSARPASSVIPLIKPLLGPGDRITGQNDTLIIKTSATLHQDIKNILARLDKPLPQYLISVKNHSRDSVRHQRILGATQTRDQQHQQQQVRVLDGHKAFISIGLERPISQANISSSGEVAINTDYKAITSGFYVVPKQTSPERVTLYISQQNQRPNRFNQSDIDTFSAQMTLNVRLGEWTRMGGVGHVRNGDQHAILYTTEDDSQRFSQLMVKVEQVQ